MSGSPTIRTNNVELPGANPPTSLVTSINGSYTSKTFASDTLLAFYTISDFGGVVTDVDLVDTQGNNWSVVDQSNSNPAGGAQSLYTFYAPNIIGDATTPNDVSSVFLNSPTQTAAYMALYLLNLQGCIVAPLVNHIYNVQNALAIGSGNLVSGGMYVSASQLPCTLIACAFNTTDLSAAPTVSGGLTSLATCFGFWTGTNLATIAYQYITTPGTYQAAFNQVAAGDSVCNAIILQGVSAINPVASLAWVS